MAAMLRRRLATGRIGDDVSRNGGIAERVAAVVHAVVEMDGLRTEYSRAVAPEAGGREETGRMAGRGWAGNDSGEGLLGGGTLPSARTAGV